MRLCRYRLEVASHHQQKRWIMNAFGCAVESPPLKPKGKSAGARDACASGFLFFYKVCFLNSCSLVAALTTNAGSVMLAGIAVPREWNMRGADGHALPLGKGRTCLLFSGSDARPASNGRTQRPSIPLCDAAPQSSLLRPRLQRVVRRRALSNSRRGDQAVHTHEPHTTAIEIVNLPLTL